VEEPVNGGPGCGAPPIILVVEDEVLIRLDNAEVLRGAGYSVIEAGDALEALGFISASEPLHLLITDINMPGEIDGIGLAEMARAMRPGMPVVLASARSVAEMAPVADRIVRKPYFASELVSIAQELIEATWQTGNDNQQAC